MRFEKGSLMVYDTTGVCRVEDVGKLEGAPVSDKTKEYYKLRPVFGSGTIYIPVETKVFMRPVISQGEAEELIRKIPEIRAGEYENKNLKLLEEKYKEALSTHECESLIKLIKTAYTRKRYLERSGKKAGKTDLQYMKRAKTLLHQELSIALGIPVEEMDDYISNAVQKPSLGQRADSAVEL